MKYFVVTVLPEVLGSFSTTGLIGKAITSGHLAIETVNPRDFATDRHRTVDDAPYGGGSGMLLMPRPMADALDSIPSEAHRVLLAPHGRPFRQADASRLSRFPSLALVCGRYEGIDARIEGRIDEVISLGDFVMLGGEVAAMAIMEATARLLPGVLGNAHSAVEESHADGLLEYPQFTRPSVFEGRAVPPVLLSGDHGKIASYRRAQSLRRTSRLRPDLLGESQFTEEQLGLLARFPEEPDAGDPVGGSRAQRGDASRAKQDPGGD